MRGWRRGHDLRGRSPQGLSDAAKAGTAAYPFRAG